MEAPHPHLIMKLIYVVCFMLPACMGFIAHVQHLKDHVHAKVQHLKDHIKEKLKKPECHVEWEDVTTPHCETHKEQVCVEEYKNQCHTEYSTSCKTEYNTQCTTEYEELCETTDHQKCHTEHDQQCHEEFNEECKTEYSEQCWDEPREACHTESPEDCSTEYSEVCGTEYEQACHTEYAEECWDEPECWVEEKEECHNVHVHDHHPKQHNKKWKRSVDGEDSEVDDMDDKLEDVGEKDGSEEDADMPEGEEGNKGEAVAADGTVRKERAVGLGALVAAHLAGANDHNDHKSFCECINPFLGSRNAYRGDPDNLCGSSGPGFCYVKCDSECTDLSPTASASRCQSSLACDVGSGEILYREPPRNNK